jgi:hypothetical protein
MYRLPLLTAAPVLIAGVFIPTQAHAKTFAEIVNGSIVPIGDLIVTLLYGVAFALFIFGMFRYFFMSGSDAAEARQKGKQHMVWGGIALVVLFSVWGLVRILLNSLQSWSV